MTTETRNNLIGAAIVRAQKMLDRAYGALDRGEYAEAAAVCGNVEELAAGICQDLDNADAEQAAEMNKRAGFVPAF
jgi:hypothetical protein